jgi:hypothetical protein
VAKLGSIQLPLMLLLLPLPGIDTLAGAVCGTLGSMQMYWMPTLLTSGLCCIALAGAVCCNAGQRL